MELEPRTKLDNYDVDQWQQLANATSLAELRRSRQMDYGNYPAEPEDDYTTVSPETFAQPDEATARVVGEKLFIGMDGRIITGAGRVALRGGQAFARETETFVQDALA